MKKLIFALVVLLGLQAVAACAVSSSQIVFPMDYIEAGVFDCTVFKIEMTDGHFDIFAVKIEHNTFDEMLLVLPTKPEEDLYSTRGALKGKALGADDLTAPEALEAFFAYCGDDVIAAFDLMDSQLPLLEEIADSCGLEVTNKVLDVTWLTRIYFQMLNSYSFESICEICGYPADKYYIPDAAIQMFKGGRQVYNYNKYGVPNP